VERASGVGWGGSFTGDPARYVKKKGSGYGHSFP